jgi:hypothetical protein
VRVTLDLRATDEQHVIRLLKRVLKVLGRQFGVRCKGISVEQ